MTRIGCKIVLEPLEVPTLDIDAWWRAIDALEAAKFLIEGASRNDAVAPDPTIGFG